MTRSQHLNTVTEEALDFEDLQKFFIHFFILQLWEFFPVDWEKNVYTIFNWEYGPILAIN